MAAGDEAVQPDPLRRAAAVVDRLVSPGGCPWDAEQTHESLLGYLVEETYEVVDAVRRPAPGNEADAHLAEELGDVLLQVLFHARIAAGRGAFDIDDVATVLAAKLVRRHPHVFESPSSATRAVPLTADEVDAAWHRQKAAERAGRGPLDGIPRELPALAAAAKLLSRAERSGIPLRADAVAGHAAPASTDLDTAEQVGAALFAVVAAAAGHGIDAEHALRDHLDSLRESHGGQAAPRPRT